MWYVCMRPPIIIIPAVGCTGGPGVNIILFPRTSVYSSITHGQPHIKLKARTVAGRGGEEPATYVTPDLSYELEGEREEDVCAKIMNGMRKINKIKNKINKARGS